VTQYLAVVPSTWSVERAFEYLSDFSNAQYWDPSVRAARRVDDVGSVKVGTRFELTVRFAGRDKTLQYAVTELDPNRRVVFSSSTAALHSLDTLTFEPRPDGCEMTYHAELRLQGAAALATPLLTVLFRRLGDRASLSLQRILGNSAARS
jgi:uncharacterized protein YndB with AHSA1/START domain